MTLRQMKQPFRIVVFVNGWRRGRLYKGRGPNHKGAHTKIEPTGSAFIAWTADTSAEPAREGYGTFCFDGIHKTRAEVVRQLADPRVHQIQVRTNQDRTLFIYNRRPDGRVTHYAAAD